MTLALGLFSDSACGLFWGLGSEVLAIWEFRKFRGTLFGVPLKGYYKGTTRVPLEGSVRI